MGNACRTVIGARSRARRAAAALVALTAATLGGPDIASACSCPDRSPEEIIATSEAIFHGTVVHATRRLVPYHRVDGVVSGPEVVWLVRIAVERTWKGAETQEVSVVIIAQSDACGEDDARIGERWHVFAWEYAGGLATNRCAARGMGEHDLTDLLGDGEAPTEPGRGPEPRAGVPYSNRPPPLRTPRGCACETTVGATTSTSAPGSWWICAAIVIGLLAGRGGATEERRRSYRR
jgi:hypothetical protein